jgi:hypothetical protein
VRVSRRWKIVIGVVAGACVALTPLYWLLGGPNAGGLAGASVQCATGVIALAWAVFAPSAVPSAAGDSAVNTGKAKATDGGRAVSGVRRPLGTGDGPARAERTGDTTAQGPDSIANSGIDYT